MFEKFNLDDEVFVWRMERFGNKNTVWRGRIMEIDTELSYLVVNVYPLEGLEEIHIKVDGRDFVYFPDEFDMHLGRR